MSGLVENNASVTASDVVVHVLSEVLPAASNYTLTPLKRKYKCKHDSRSALSIRATPCLSKEYKTDECCR